jgi:hypothetical protein
MCDTAPQTGTTTTHQHNSNYDTRTTNTTTTTTTITNTTTTAGNNTHTQQTTHTTNNTNTTHRTATTTHTTHTYGTWGPSPRQERELWFMPTFLKMLDRLGPDDATRQAFSSPYICPCPRSCPQRLRARRNWSVLGVLAGSQECMCPSMAMHYRPRSMHGDSPHNPP